jgi:long-chain acyl-CoA synthetase
MARELLQLSNIRFRTAKKEAWVVVGDLLARNTRKFPDRIAIRQGGVSITYRELNERADRLANALLALGLKKGDRIGVLLPSTHEFYEIYFAAAKTGAIFCPFNVLFREKELTDIIEYSAPRFLFFEGTSADRISAVRHGKTRPRRLIHLGPVPFEYAETAQSQDYGTLMAQGAATDPRIAVKDDDVMSIFFTSGTTGKPLGAMRTHRHVITAAYTTAIEERTCYGDRVLITSPLDHVSFESNLGRCLLMPNTAIIWGAPFDPHGVLEALVRERVTVASFVPAMINALVRYPDIPSFDLSSLRLIVYAGAPIPLEVLKKALRVFEPLGVRFLQHYGLTESGPSMTVLPPEDHVLEESDPRSARLSSAGRPVLDCEVRIVNEEGRDVTPGEVGEIIGRGETIMKGYWGLPGLTAQKITDGWLHTGDLGRFDEDGYIYLVNRKGDTIIRGGENISPREIEEVLYTFPGIIEAAVIGVPDDLWGESIKALVVMREGITISRGDIINFCGHRLADYKKPQSIEFCRELPKNPQGKILKRALREKYWAGSGRTV